MDRTFAIFKPHAVKDGNVGAMISQLESEDFKIVSMRLEQPGKPFWEGHYEAHRGKDFFEPLVESMDSGPVVFLVLERKDAVAHLRAIAGATDPAVAEPGTIRHLFGNHLLMRENAIHGSGNVEEAASEIARYCEFFGITLPQAA